MALLSIWLNENESLPVIQQAVGRLIFSENCATSRSSVGLIEFLMTLIVSASCSFLNINDFWAFRGDPNQNIPKLLYLLLLRKNLDLSLVDSSIKSNAGPFSGFLCSWLSQDRILTSKSAHPVAFAVPFIHWLTIVSLSIFVLYTRI